VVSIHFESARDPGSGKERSGRPHLPWEPREHLSFLESFIGVNNVGTVQGLGGSHQIQEVN
jgi:hypothetical protein